jgi:hypothetical protein
MSDRNPVTSVDLRSGAELCVSSVSHLASEL